MKNIAKLILGAVYPVICLTLGLGIYISTHSNLPNRITILFDITRVPIASIPETVFMLAMSAVLIFSTLICIYIALQKRPFNLVKYQNIASHGGFFSAISAFLMSGAAVTHEGLTNWRDATGPGWWLLLVIISGFAGSSLTKNFTKTIHDQLLEDSEKRSDSTA